MQAAESFALASNPLSNLRFLEYSVPCDNVLETLGFFQELGFTALPTNDIWNYPYAVITDGRCFLGLHEKNYFEQLTNQPRMSFVHEEIKLVTDFLRDNSFSILKSSISEDEFQHTICKGLNQADINIVAARSFSPPPKENRKDSLLGYFRGIVMPTANLEKSFKFWEQMGMLVMETANENAISVSANHLNMLLVDDDNHKIPGLLFEHPKPEELLEPFANLGINPEVSDQCLVLNSEYLIKTPNGVNVWVKREV